jgi:hypothetical protein
MTLIWPLTSQRMIKRPAFKCPIIRFLPSEFFRGRCVCILPVSSQKAVCTPYSSPLFYFND